MCHVFFKIIVFRIISRRIVSSLGHNTFYQDRGKSADRVKMALKKPCCKAKCKRRVTFQMVMSVCITFWSLTKTAQDSLTLASHFIFTLIIFCSMFMYVCFFQPNGFGIQYLFLLFPRLWSLQNPTYMDKFSEASDDDAADSDSDGSESSSSSLCSSQSSRSTSNHKVLWFLQGNLSKKF